MTTVLLRLKAKIGVEVKLKEPRSKIKTRSVGPRSSIEDSFPVTRTRGLVGERESVGAVSGGGLIDDQTDKDRATGGRQDWRNTCAADHDDVTDVILIHTHASRVRRPVLDRK